MNIRFLLLFAACLPCFVSGCGADSGTDVVPLLEDKSVYEAEQERFEKEEEELGGGV